MFFYYKNLYYLLILLLIQGCATGGGLAPVTNRTEIEESKPVVSDPSETKLKNKKSHKKIQINKNDCYIVSKGDTLYSIAWRYDYDYKKLANWNEITPPYIIHLGRKICFKPIKVKKALKSKSKSDATDSVIDEKTGSNRNLKKSTNLTDKKISKKKTQSRPRMVLANKG